MDGSKFSILKKQPKQWGKHFLLFLCGAIIPPFGVLAVILMIRQLWIYRAQGPCPLCGLPVEVKKKNTVVSCMCGTNLFVAHDGLWMA